MAANDYYSSFRREDAPLPPIPSSRPEQQKPYGDPPSPVVSPFEDHSYPYSKTNQPSQPSLAGDSAYYGASGYSHGPAGHASPTDPFRDDNAIPLQSQPSKHESTQGLILPQDPEAAAAATAGQERRHRTRRRQPKKKKGWLSGRVTWVCYILTVVQCGVFIGELIKNAQLTGTPIQLKPNFNFMIGPSPYVLINMGGRYVPCMHNIKDFTNSELRTQLPCPNSVSNDRATFTCSLPELCGFGGQNVVLQPPNTPFSDRSQEPNQWWRFIVPIFLHAGLIHIGFNMLLQWTLGRDMEKEIGSIRFFLVYFSSGIFGFVLGGNYAATGIVSTGASGSLFGVLALTLLDLLYTWSSRRKPHIDLMFLVLDIAISFVLGLLPGLDNFSHIGGFLMGLVLGLCIMHSPPAIRRRTGQTDTPYSTVDTGEGNGEERGAWMKGFAKQPIGFFTGRKGAWWVWWLLRAGALTAVLICFILLLNNFYVARKECSWCRHLSCLPVKDWCNVGNIVEKQKPA